MDMNKYHIRIFLTPKCNLRCIYCNEEGTFENRKIMSTSQIKNILSAARDLEIHKLHYSGGEPTLRPDLEEIINFASYANFDDQTITSNGVLLSKYVTKLKKAGLTRVNISLDTLNPQKFKYITNVDAFDKVWYSVETVLDNYDYVKLNVVMMKNNEYEILDFLKISHEYNGRIVPKFIELVPNNPVFYNNFNLVNERINREYFFKIVSSFGKVSPIKFPGENPNCEYFSIEGTDARFGLITNHSFNYRCGDCGKIRVSPFGEIGYCINFDKAQTNENTNYLEVLENILEIRNNLNNTHPDRKHFSSDYGHWRFGTTKRGCV